MGFLTQFKTFDPISADAPDSPFSYLPDIAWRARRLLKHRTANQITSIAESIDWAIDAYFDDLMAEDYERLRKERGWNIDEKGIAYFEPYFIDEDGCESDTVDPDNPPKELVYGGKHTDPEDGALGNWFYVDLDTPTSSNTSELDALQECAEYWEEICIVNGASDVKPYELFAVLSLWLIADSINWLGSKKIDLEGLWIEDINGVRTTFPSCNFAADYAVKAMEAVCYAEHLHEIERMQAIHKSELTKTQSDYLIEKTNQEEERKRRQERMAELSQQRHKKTYEAKAMVIAEWEKQPDKFPSGEKAGLHFSDWLLEKGIEFQPRAVTGWIREAAKERGVRFR